MRRQNSIYDAAPLQIHCGEPSESLTAERSPPTKSFCWQRLPRWRMKLIQRLGIGVVLISGCADQSSASVAATRVTRSLVTVYRLVCDLILIEFLRSDSEYRQLP